MGRRGPKPTDPESRIWKFISPEPNTGCWLWVGTYTNGGYGVIHSSAHKRPIRVHRLLYEKKHGAITGGMFACHKCDTPECVNPDHIFLGDQIDNARDMMAKGRGAGQFGRGHKKHPKAFSSTIGTFGGKRITKEIEDEIRRLRGAGDGIKRIASRLGIGEATVWRRLRRKTDVQESR